MELCDGGGRGAELSSARGRVFRLLNAVTEFVDYERRAHTEDHWLDFAWFGASAVVKQKSLGQAMLLVQ